MAFKRYAYFNKGNKVALVEESSHSTSGFLAVAHCTLSGYTTKDTCEAAGGQWIPSSGSSTSDTMYEKYTSPNDSVTGGLEIEYSYAPTFNFQNRGKEGVDFHRFLGWGSNGTNLILFAFGNGATVDLSSLFKADDWIHVSGSGRWSGLHQVSEGGDTGLLILRTKCNIPAAQLETTVTWNSTADTANGTNTARDVDIETFKSETSKRSKTYVFINNAADVADHGFFSLSSDDTVGQLSFDRKYSIDANGNYTSAAAANSDESNDVIAIFNAFYEEITVREGVEVLEDESFEFDLTEYQAQAVVYYVKAKIAEDRMDAEGREYFMKLFKKQMEKGASSRKRGPYIVRGFI